MKAELQHQITHQDWIFLKFSLQNSQVYQPYHFNLVVSIYINTQKCDKNQTKVVFFNKQHDTDRKDK